MEIKNYMGQIGIGVSILVIYALIEPVIGKIKSDLSMSDFWISYFKSALHYIGCMMTTFLVAKFFPQYSFFSLKDNYRLYDGNQRLIIAFEQIDKIFSPQAVNAVYEETRGIAFYKIYLKKVKVLRKEVQRLLTDKNEPLNILLKDIDEELSSCKESEVLLKRGLDKMISTFDKYNERITEARRHIAGNYLMMRMQEQD